MLERAFMQVDVFTDTAYFGNPVGVVLEAKGISDEQMQQVTSWANLSETTFVLPPTEPFRRLPGEDFHPRQRIAIRGPSDAGDRPRLARLFGSGQGRNNPRMRQRARAGPARCAGASPLPRRPWCAQGQSRTTNWSSDWPACSTSTRQTSSRLSG